MKIAWDTRRQKYYRLSSKLAQLNQTQINNLLEEKNTTKGWGTNHIIKIANTRVFIKRIPLTKLEYQHFFSTKNLYNLPTYYNYGVGSAGFGAFRELVTHIKTTNWVLAGEHENFPLMYHYRIVPCTNESIKPDLEKHEKYVKYWNNNQNISKYILARKQAEYEIMIFLEHVPYVLHKWLNRHKERAGTAVTELMKTVTFLRKKGIIHFDAHFANILTDGEKFYLGDFGLALDCNFELNKREKIFFKQHQYYDYGEILCGFGSELFDVYEKQKVKLQKYGITEKTKDSNGLIILLKNIEEICSKGILDLDKNYLELIKNYREIIIMFIHFYTELRRDHQKKVRLNFTKYKALLKETKLI